MRILVTGSAGFIGRHLVAALAMRGDDVAGLDLRPAGDVLPERRQFICDLRDAAATADAVSRFAPDAVLHLAARTDLDETRDVAGYAANIAGVENLVEALAATPSVRRAIFTSTQLVCRVGYAPRDELDYCPHTLYGESKVRTEAIVRTRDGGVAEWCLVRPTTIWGPGMSSHYRRFLEMIQRGRYFHVGSKPLYKSYGYVENVVFQYIRLLEAPAGAIHRRTFYLADYEPIELYAWAEAFRQAFRAPRIRRLPLLAAVVLAKVGDAVNAAGFRRFPFNSFRLNNILTEYRFDLAATEEVCGTLPYSMADGIQRTAGWILAPGRASV